MKVLLTHIYERGLGNEMIVGLEIGNQAVSEYTVEIPEDKKEGKTSLCLGDSLLFELVELGRVNEADEAFYIVELGLIINAYITGNEKFDFPVDLSKSGLGFKKKNWIQKFLRKAKWLLQENR